MSFYTTPLMLFFTYMQWAKKQTGFTIVELLIVVVVIAILAAITIVSYNGITNRAKNSAAQSAASQAGKKLSQFYITNNDTYPEATGTNGIANLSSLGLINSGDTTYEYSANNTTNPKTFCLTVTKQLISYYVSSLSLSPTAGGCQGHAQNGVSVITNLATNPRAINGGAVWGNQTPTGGDVGYEATNAQDGGSTYRVTTTQAGQIRISIPRQAFSVVNGDTVSVSLDLQAPVATQIQIELGANGTFPKSSVISVPQGWSRVSGSVPITSTSAGAVTLVQIVGVSTNLPASQTWRATKAIITIGTTTYQYADGNTTNWSWNGTANNSTSTGIPIPN